MPLAAGTRVGPSEAVQRSTHRQKMSRQEVWMKTRITNLEIEYYETLYKPSQFRNQAAHAATWGDT